MIKVNVDVKTKSRNESKTKTTTTIKKTKRTKSRKKTKTTKSKAKTTKASSTKKIPRRQRHDVEIKRKVKNNNNNNVKNKRRIDTSAWTTKRTNDTNCTIAITKTQIITKKNINIAIKNIVIKKNWRICRNNENKNRKIDVDKTRRDRKNFVLKKSIRNYDLDATTNSLRRETHSSTTIQFF